MKTFKASFSSKTTTFWFNDSMLSLPARLKGERLIFVTDEQVFASHTRLFKNFETIVVPAGETHKHQGTVDRIVLQLIERKADRKSILVGVGGGVVTDMAGYAASVYMRGIRFGFVPTTILAMVDAAIGGKNGVDVGVYKNLVGTIRQPDFLLYDFALLKSLPHEQWVNGFAEVIKHAAIKDARMFSGLENTTVAKLKRDKTALASLIERNAKIKIRVVQADEFEVGERRLLNFGHTLGHAIENELALMHGHAIAVGMVYAAQISSWVKGFAQHSRLVTLLEQFELPTNARFDLDKALAVASMDKKREGNTMNFVLLNRLGNAVVHKIPIDDLAAWFRQV
jgi:3-dehydroquinate synthase